MSTSISKQKMCDNRILQKYNEWDNLFWKKYFKVFKDAKYTITDGVLFPEFYASSPIKVMFLNKEPYDPEYAEFSVNETMRDQIMHDIPILRDQRTLRTHLKQYLRVLDSIVNNELFVDSNEVHKFVEEACVGDNYLNKAMHHVAFVNIKKSDGQYPSNTGNLYEYANKGWNLLKEQICFYNPTLILGGNVCDGIMDRIIEEKNKEKIQDVEWGRELYTKPDRTLSIWELKIDDKIVPFVDMYHPSRIAGMSEYFYELYTAIKTVEEKFPGYWKARLNQETFVFTTLK